MHYFGSIEVFQVGHNLPFVETYRQGWPDLCSLQYLCQGSMLFGVDDEPPRQLSAPLLYWVDPRCRYYLGPTDAQDDLRHYVLFRGTRAREMMEDGFSRLDSAGYVQVAAPKKMGKLWDRLLAAYETATPHSRAEAAIILEEMLLLLAGERVIGDSNSEPAIEEVMRRMRAEPFARFDLQALARAHHMSYSQFRKKFRRHANTSPHDYALRCRMEAAARLLLKPDMRISEVAAQAGYDDPAQFSRDFSTRLGLSPRQYRNAPR